MHAFHEDVEDREAVLAVGDVPALSFLPKPLQWLQNACVLKANVLQVEYVSGNAFLRFACVVHAHL